MPNHIVGPNVMVYGNPVLPPGYEDRWMRIMATLGYNYEEVPSTQSEAMDAKDDASDRMNA